MSKRSKATIESVTRGRRAASVAGVLGGSAGSKTGSGSARPDQLAPPSVEKAARAAIGEAVSGNRAPSVQTATSFIGSFGLTAIDGLLSLVPRIAFAGFDTFCRIVTVGGGKIASKVRGSSASSACRRNRALRAFRLRLASVRAPCPITSRNGVMLISNGLASLRGL